MSRRKFLLLKILLEIMKTVQMKKANNKKNQIKKLKKNFKVHKLLKNIYFLKNKGKKRKNLI